MPTNTVVITIKDGGLGNTQPPSQKVQAVCGTCTGGAINTNATPGLYSTKAALINDYGYGPAVEYACMAMDAGAQVIFAKTNGNDHVGAGAAGSSSALVVTGVTGTAVPSLSVATSYDDYDGRVKIITGGSLGTAGIVFQYSLDNGRTYSANVALGTALTYAIPNSGLTITFGISSATYIAGDNFYWHSFAPTWGDTDVQSCITALGASSTLPLWGADIVLTGKMAGADLTAIDGYLSTLATTNFKYTRLLGEARDINNINGTGGAQETEAAWITSIQNSFAAVSSVRIMVAAGACNVTSSITGRQYRRSVLWTMGKRRCLTNSPATHLGEMDLGALPNASFGPASDLLVYHDERITPGLDGTRFATVWTVPGFPGLFCKNPNLMNPVGSDYTILPYGDVMDVGCATLRAAEMLYINKTVRLNPATGFILENDARQMEVDVGNKMYQALVATGYASAVSYQVSRTDNINSTKTITTTAQITALGYILEIDSTIQFQNPVLAA